MRFKRLKTTSASIALRCLTIVQLTTSLWLAAAGTIASAAFACFGNLYDCMLGTKRGVCTTATCRPSHALLHSSHYAYSRVGPARHEQSHCLSNSDDGQAALEDWALAAGIVASQLAPGAGCAGRGVFAKSKISGKAPVVSMPRGFALSAVAGQSCPMPDLIPAKLWDLSDE